MIKASEIKAFFKEKFKFSYSSLDLRILCQPVEVSSRLFPVSFQLAKGLPNTLKAFSTGFSTLHSRQEVFVWGLKDVAFFFVGVDYNLPHKNFPCFEETCIVRMWCEIKCVSQYNSFQCLCAKNVQLIIQYFQEYLMWGRLVWDLLYSLGRLTVLISPIPEHWDYRCAFLCPVYIMLRMKPKAKCIIGQQSTN